MAQLNISLLGTFQITIDHHPLTEFDSNKIRALLVYLAVEADRPHTREALSALLWPDCPQESALSSLRNALASLRRTIGDREAHPPYLLITRESIQFNRASNAEMDLWEFEESAKNAMRNRAAQPKIENLQSAISLYRGPFLAGFSIPDSIPFEEWLMLKREQLTQQAIRSLRQLAYFYEACGEYEPALVYARHQVQLEPWLEEAYRQMMRLLALSGQRSAALAQYETCKRALAEELAIEPSSETTQLYETIQAGRLGDIRLNEPLPAPGEPPFKGLHFFDEPDAALFFGREALTQRLLAHIQDMLNSTRTGTDSKATLEPSQPLPISFFAIIGASGSGKSSLVRAGLVPKLRQAGFDVRVITPGANPTPPPNRALLDPPPHRETTDEGRLAPLIGGFPMGGQKGVLVIDQFEELFTLCHDETERRAFLDTLLLSSPLREGWVGVVLVLRADFYGHCSQYPHLRQALCARQEYIGPMDATELRRAIEEPARQNGWDFEPGLVELILRDVGASEGHPPEPGALPLLEHALLETWKRRRGRTLTLKGYAESGGVRGAIAHTAENVLAQLSAVEQALARRIFLRLTELGEGTQDTRRRTLIREMAQKDSDLAQVTGLLHSLAEARLITLAEDTAEVAHEALIREWPTLRQWLNEDREGLRLHRHLTDRAQSWQRLGRDVGELYRGSRLAQASEWAAVHEQELNALEREFLHAAHQYAEHETAEREAQRQRALDAAIQLAETERQRAEEKSLAAQRLRCEANLSYAQELAAISHSKLSTQPDLSLLLALRAVDTLQENEQSLPWNIQQAVHDVALTSRLIWSHFTPRQPWAVEYLPDGGQIAFIDDDECIRFLDSASGAEMQVIQAKGSHFCVTQDLIFSTDGAGVYGWERTTGQQRLTIPLIPREGEYSGQVTISRDGKSLAATDRNHQAYLFEMQPLLAACASTGIYTAPPLKTYPFAAEICRGLAFSPDGKFLLTGVTHEKFFILWDVASGQKTATLTGHTDKAMGASFSPDGRRIATCSFDSTARIWEVTSGQELMRLTGHTHWVNSIAYSPDGARLATAGFDGQVIIWDAASGLRLFTLPTGGGAFGLAFSPDGTCLVTTAESGFVQLWDVTPGGRGELGVFPLPQKQILSISPDSSCLLEIGSDQQFSLRDLLTFTERPIWNARSSSKNAIYASLNSDNTLLAASCAGQLNIWRIPSGEWVFRQPVAAGWDEHMDFPPAFSPASDRLATGGYPGKISIWNLATAQVIQILPITMGAVWDTKFSPNGRFLAVGGAVNWRGSGGQLWLWDLTSAELAPQALIIPGDTRAVSHLSFSPDGQHLAACGCDSIAKIWQVSDLLQPRPTHEPTIELRGHLARLNTLRYSPDGYYLLTNSADKTIKVWDAQSGEELLSYVLTGPGGFESASFTADGQKVVARGKAHIHYTFAFQNFGELLTIVRQRIIRDWQPEERRKYLERESN